MSTNRLFNLLVAMVLVMMVLLTVRAGVATSQVATDSPNAAGHLTGLDGTLRLNLHDPRQITGTQALAVSAPNTIGHTLSQQTRDAIRARWMARFGDTHRTCVLLCGGQ
jgi:hypothetical protein